MPLTDAYARFVEAYGDPECCGKIHWNPERLESWLREQREWDGEWDSLAPELLIKAASVAWDDYCPES
jgi:hypothetical protein